ncbi:hypothetical protein [Pseudonocardia humida]|uniref:hypothetical protein n=1 Tax=Pseudonocardia humida TaxID=2800819 RepID=UPI00207C47A2|nr:hypothetical protein [Pseudonocardia humida]
MADNEEEERSTSGRMRFQDETTTPREPTLAERRAREQARKRAEEAERAAEEEADRKKRVRKRVLVGTGVTVGVVAVIAVGYALAAPDDVVEAQCVDEETGVVVDDANCVTPAANPTYHGGGGYFIFVGDGGRQYRYNYGGSGTFGSRVSGGTAIAPKDGVTVRTPSGRTLSGGSAGTPPRTSGGTSAGSGSSSSGSSAGSPSVSRGGLGVNGTGSSSGS